MRISLFCIMICLSGSVLAMEGDADFIEGLEQFTKKDLNSLIKTNKLPEDVSSLVRHRFEKLCDIMRGEEDIEVVDQKTAEIKAVQLSPDVEMRLLIGDEYTNNRERAVTILLSLGARVYTQLELKGLEPVDKTMFIATFVKEKMKNMDVFYKE